MTSILPRLAVVLALLTSGGWAAAGAPAPTNFWTPSAPSAPVAAAVEGTPTPSALDEILFIENGRHVNSVEAENRRDGRFELQGRADYVREKQDDVTAGNQAVAHATCTDCQTIALALQIVVYRQGATNVAPRNFAIAVNDQCTRCLTVAHAVQYVIPVADPNDLPVNVKDLVHELNKEMNEIERIRALNEGNILQVEAQVNAIIARFDSLRDFLYEDRREAAFQDAAPVQQPAVAPTSTPVPATATPLATATLVATATAVPPTATMTPSPAATP